MMSTPDALHLRQMAGKPFYLKCGYRVEAEWQDENGAVPVPLATMVKTIADEAI